MTYGYGLLFAFLAAIFWGIAPILYKRALREMGLLKANFFRGLGMLAALFPVFCFASAETMTDLRSLSLNSYLVLALIALMNNMVGDVLFLAAIRDIGVSLAAPITNSYPLAVALIAWLWYGETLTVSVLGGTVCVVIGLTLLNISGPGTPGIERSRHMRGVTAAFLAAMCWALGLTLNKYLILEGVSPTAITFWRGFIYSLMAIASLPLAIRDEKKTRNNGTQLPKTRRASYGSVLAAACSGISALAIGGWFYTTSLLIIPITVATPLASSNPLLAATFACAFMGESLRPAQWLGIAFAMGGVIAVGI